MASLVVAGVVVGEASVARGQAVGVWLGDLGTEAAPSPWAPVQESSAADTPQADDSSEARELAASFEPALAPYGTWTDDPTYGRVWIPAVEVVGESFVPYASNGHWIYTTYGWTWVSDWEWGWAPFHYGRWARLDGQEWCWVPGTAWAPAWVSWRAGSGYAGWAALAPRLPAGEQTRAEARDRTRELQAAQASWVFVRDFDLGQPHPSFQAGRRAGELYRLTSPVRESRLVLLGLRQILVNPGPTIRRPAVRGQSPFVGLSAMPFSAVGGAPAPFWGAPSPGHLAPAANQAPGAQQSQGWTGSLYGAPPAPGHR